MNKTVVFVTFAVLVALAIAGTVFLLIFKEDSFGAYSAFIVNLLGVTTVAAGTFAVLGRTNQKVEQIKEQTNGTLSKLLADKDTQTATIRTLERENAELKHSVTHKPRKAVNNER